MNKEQTIKELVTKNPRIRTVDLAKKAKCSYAYASNIRNKIKESSPQTTDEPVYVAPKRSKRQIAQDVLTSAQIEVSFLKKENNALRSQQYEVDKLDNRIGTLEIRLIEKTKTIVEQKAIINYLESKMFALIKGGGNG